MTDVPDRIGEIVAFRAWFVRWSPYRPERVALLSLNHEGTWPTDDWFRATCPRHAGHKAPQEGCTCGIYAGINRLHLSDLGYNEWGSERQLLVIGEVGLAGKIIPGTQGWKAERARPLRLWAAHFDWEIAGPLATAYQVPVELTNVLKGDHADGHRTGR